MSFSVRKGEILGLAGLMVCRVRFIKLSRVLVPAVRKLPEEIRWTVGLLIIPIIASIHG